VDQSLFQGKLVTLSALELDRDAETISRWTHDPGYLHLTEIEPARPLSPAQVRKNLQPGDREGNTRFIFAVHSIQDDRLAGLARLDWIDWPNGSAWIKVEMGLPVDRSNGFASDALDLLLRYAFHELNLIRVTSRVFEYAISDIQLLEGAGFYREARLRETLLRSGRRWDTFVYGLLQAEWEKGRARPEAAG
jgi:RimJ/RimL family protein N-acetyltransferase